MKIEANAIIKPNEPSFPELQSGQTSFNWNRARIKVPRYTLPTHLGVHKNNNINVEYQLRFRMEPGCGKDVKVNIPIIIGTIPLHQIC